MTNIQQTHYPALEINAQETDIIELWQGYKSDSQVIQVERGNIDAVIEILLKAKNTNIS